MFCPLAQCLQRPTLHLCPAALAVLKIHKVRSCISWVSSSVHPSSFIPLCSELILSCFHCRSPEEDLHEGGWCLKLLQKTQQTGGEVSGWDQRWVLFEFVCSTVDCGLLSPSVCVFVVSNGLCVLLYRRASAVQSTTIETSLLRQLINLKD